VKSIDQAHPSTVYSVSYSPNGRVLVSASGKNTMKIWDAETFEREFTTNQLTTTANSNFVVSANEDNTVRITSCREFAFVPSCLTPVLNLILHIVYKWEFVSFLEPNENTPTLEEVMKKPWRVRAQRRLQRHLRDPLLPLPSPPPRIDHPR